jgi:hypothetical protein
MAGQDLTPLARKGATIAFQIAWEGRPTCTAVFDAERIVEHMAAAETHHELVPDDRDRPGSHGHMHRACLGLIMENADPALTDWIPAAATGLLWSGLHHPGLGRRNVDRAVALIAEKGHATMAFEIRDGGLWFEVFDIPLPGAPMAMPLLPAPTGPCAGEPVH